MLNIITSDWLWHPADPSRDHLRKLCSLKFSCEPGWKYNIHTHTHSLQCHRTLSHLSYLWHCYGYILFAALVSEVWEPPCPVTPTVHPTHPPIVTAIWYYTAWQRPWVTKSTADSEFEGLDCVFHSCWGQLNVTEMVEWPFMEYEELWSLE